MWCAELPWAKEMTAAVGYAAPKNNKNDKGPSRWPYLVHKRVKRLPQVLQHARLLVGVQLKQLLERLDARQLEDQTITSEKNSR